MNLFIVLPCAAICILLIIVGCFTYFSTHVSKLTSLSTEKNAQEHISQRLPTSERLEMMHYVSHGSSTDEDHTTHVHYCAKDEEQELEEPDDAEEFSEVDMDDEKHDSPFNTHNPFC